MRELTQRDEVDEQIFVFQRLDVIEVVVHVASKAKLGQFWRGWKNKEGKLRGEGEPYQLDGTIDADALPFQVLAQGRE